MPVINYRRFSPRKIKGFIRRKISRPSPRSDRVKQKWAIGIYEGSSLTDLRPARRAVNPVLRGEDVSDISGRFVADPFMIEGTDGWRMFFEIWNRERGQGEIGVARSADGYDRIYERVILAEPFHLSYPYVFEWKGEHYMIPETYQTRTVRLYKAAEFPYRWELNETLLSGMRFKDASVFHHGNTWWMFVETSPLLKCDVLRLYYADDLRGPWTEHPRSPLVAGDPRIARPAGRVMQWEGKIIRFAQACDCLYGLRVHTFEVIKLSREEYQEREILDGVKLEGSGHGWNAGGMHHIDVHTMKDGRLLACVDGWLDSRAKRPAGRGLIGRAQSNPDHGVIDHGRR